MPFEWVALKSAPHTVEEGTYPFYKSTEDAEIREERRLLYVAMTRAQAALVRTAHPIAWIGTDENRL